MSYGGSAILMNLVALAIVLRVDIENRHARCAEAAHEPPRHHGGGHRRPRHSRASRSRARCSARGWSVSWLGTRTAWRTSSCRRAGIALDTHRLHRPARQGPGAHADRRPAPARRPSGTAWRILRRRSADAVLGMGGYVCFPGGLMASLLGKPLVLVNADAVAADEQQGAAAGGRPRGLRLRRRRPRRRTQARVVTGNPVRAEIEALPRAGRALRRPQRRRCSCWSSAAASAPRC